MSRRIVVPAPGQRLAIRVDEHTLLAVPHMAPGAPSETRIKVFELVLRRQPFAAFDAAQESASPIENSATARAVEYVIDRRPNDSVLNEAV